MKKRLVLLMLLLLILFIFGFLFINNKNNNAKAEGEDIFNTKSNETNNKPKENEPYKESTIIESNNTDEKEEIELKYDQYVIANGFMGASDNAYYTRNKVLYHLIISSNETTKIAEGVKKIEEDKDTLLVYKDKNFKIVTEDSYITYVD